MIERKTVNGHDVLYAIIDPAANDIDAEYLPGDTIKEIGEHVGADLAVNFNFADDKIGAPIGRLIVGGKVVVQDIQKTKARDELYQLPDGTLHIGKASAGALWAVQGSPRLLTDGKPDYKRTIDRDDTGRDIWTGESYRTAAGITAAGKLVVVRTLSTISIEELTSIMQLVGCRDALNGDGGGSSYLWPENNSTGGRKLGSALVVKRKLIGMTKGIDCANPLNADKAVKLAAAGQRFAARYLVPIEYKWKRLTRAEAEAITAAGMQIVSVFETTANRPAGGAANGKVDGPLALAEAKAIGQPAGTAIYFAVDYEPLGSEDDAIERYLRACGGAIPGYEVGVYGSYAVIEEMYKRGAAKHFWQTYAWSYGKKSAHANIWQYKNDQTLAGHSVDLNESYGNEGWWNTKPVVVNPPVDEEYDTLVVTIGKREALLNGKPYELTVDPTNSGGRVMIGLRDAVEAFGGVVGKWDNKTQTATLKMPRK